MSAFSRFTSVELSTPTEVAAAREKHRLLNNELVKLNGAIRDTEDTLKNMELHYGREGEWKKLDGSCVDEVVGE